MYGSRAHPHSPWIYGIPLSFSFPPPIYEYVMKVNAELANGLVKWTKKNGEIETLRWRADQATLRLTSCCEEMQALKEELFEHVPLKNGENDIVEENGILYRIYKGGDHIVIDKVKVSKYGQ